MFLSNYKELISIIISGIAVYLAFGGLPLFIYFIILYEYRKENGK